MNLETSKKVLRIAGILSIIGGVFAFIIGILGVTGGGAVAGAPDASADAVQTGALAIGAGFMFLFIAVLALVEGIVSYIAGKNGHKTTATFAMVFAVLTLVSSIYNSFQNGGQSSGIFGLIINIAFNALVVYAAYIVRKNAEA